MTLTILIVEKNGDIKEQKVNNINEAELYKKVGLKSSNGFKMQTGWNINYLKGKSYNIRLYGKIEGRANYENKYEFPPPVDDKLFFGNCILINKETCDEYTNLTKAEWNTVYDHLYGGFDDLDDEEDSEDDVDDDVPRTKSGYVKDSFIVDDDEDEDEDEDEDYVGGRKKSKKIGSVRKSTRNKNKETTLFNAFTSSSENHNYLECTGELSEEEYL